MRADADDENMIYLSPPHLSEEAMSYLQDAVQSNWIAPVGPHIDAFEQELASVLKTAHVVATNSGTSAIHLGLLALGVGVGDEVVCSSFTFCASVNPVLYCGATPVFVDSDKASWNLDPALLEEAIIDRIEKTGKKPKAIIAVHIYGMPASMDRIMEISHKHGIPVLEDAAEALGSLYEGRPVGTIGSVGVLSFNGNKIITTSGGGALLSSDANLISKARYFGAEAKEAAPYYEHKNVGFNYRLSNLLAAVGRSQLPLLQDRMERRRSVFEFYKKGLSSFSSIGFQNEPVGSMSNRWLTCITFSGGADTRDIVRLALAEEDIESRLLWKPMHQQPVFAHYPCFSNGVAESLFDSGLCLPSGSSLENGDLQRILEILVNTIP